MSAEVHHRVELDYKYRAQETQNFDQERKQTGDEHETWFKTRGN